MKPVLSDKYSIAWFKIAECIAKGERERALGMYRLLSHSIDNQALAKQLEADILLFFADERAQVRYKEAAFLYANQQKFLEAIALYEHLLSVGAPSSELIGKLVEWSFQLSHAEKIRLHGCTLAQQLLEKNEFEEFQRLFEKIIGAAGHDEKTVSLMLKKIEHAQAHGMSESQIMNIVQDALDMLMIVMDSKMLQLYISQLEREYPDYINRVNLK